MKKFYVYILLDPRKPGSYEYGFGESTLRFDYEPFYVGKGTGDRVHQHYWPVNYKLHHPRNYKIKRIINDIADYKVFKILITTSDEDTAFAVEVETINIIGRADVCKGPLTNLTDGGEGVAGRVCSEETKEKIRLSQLGKYVSPETGRKISAARMGRFSGENSAVFGVPKSEEVRRKISRTKTGVPLSEETKQRIGASLRGRELSEEHKRKIGDGHRGKEISEQHRRAVSVYQTGRVHTEEQKLRANIAKCRYRYTLVDTRGKTYITYVLKFFASSLGITDTTLLRTFTNGRFAGGYKIVAKERLPKDWINSPYYTEYLELGGVDVRKGYYSATQN